MGLFASDRVAWLFELEFFHSIRRVGGLYFTPGLGLVDVNFFFLIVGNKYCVWLKIFVKAKLLLNSYYFDF